MVGEEGAGVCTNSTTVRGGGRRGDGVACGSKWRRSTTILCLFTFRTPPLQALAKLRAAGYTLVTSADVFPAAVAAAGAGGSSSSSSSGTAATAIANALEGRGREYRAMIEYFVGLRAQR